MYVNVRAADEHDGAFIAEMAREASTIENRPLPAADSEDVRTALPQDLGAAVVAVNSDAVRLGAAWWHDHDPPLARDTSGRPLPELIVAVRAEDRGHGIGSSLIEALTLKAAWQFPRLCSTCTSGTQLRGSTHVPGSPSWERGVVLLESRCAAT